MGGGLVHRRLVQHCHRISSSSSSSRRLLGGLGIAPIGSPPAIGAGAKQAPSAPNKARTMEPVHDLKLLIVGDVHYTWDDRDAAALEALAPDITLFVGEPPPDVG